MIFALKGFTITEFNLSSKKKWVKFRATHKSTIIIRWIRIKAMMEKQASIKVMRGKISHAIRTMYRPPQWRKRCYMVLLCISIQWGKHASNRHGKCITSLYSFSPVSVRTFSAHWMLSSGAIIISCLCVLCYEYILEEGKEISCDLCSALIELIISPPSTWASFSIWFSESRRG